MSKNKKGMELNKQSCDNMIKAIQRMGKSGSTCDEINNSMKSLEYIFEIYKEDKFDKVDK